MTDEERQKLVSKLLEIVHGTDFRDMWIRPYVKDAADEIERLAEIIKDYKLVFGDIHKTELAELKARIEAYDRGNND